MTKFYYWAFSVLILLSFSCKKIEPPKTTAQEFLSIGGDFIYFMEKGEGRSLVLLHGLPDHSLNQLRLMEGLAKTENVYVYDRKGMGLSSKPDLSYTLPQQIEELHHFIQIKGLTESHQKPALFGHSVGGTIAVGYAAKYPEKVRALVLLNPTLIFKRGHTGLKDWNTWLLKQPVFGETFMHMHSRYVTKQILNHMFYDKSKITEEMINRYHFPFQMKGANKHFLGTLRSLYELGNDGIAKYIEKVKQNNIPVLLFWTAKDPNMPVKDSYDLAIQLNATLHVIPDCGHLPQLELDDQNLYKEIIFPTQDFLKNLK